MTAPDAPRSAAWSRRTLLRALAPLPLLAAAGCAGGGGAGAGQAGHAGAPTAGGAPAGAGTRPPGTASATPRASQDPGAASPSAAAPAPRPEVSDAPAVTDAVALTFHGDGTPELATALLGEAEKTGARLTVLAVGQWLARYPQMAERVLQGGHELGNHTEHHLQIDAMSAEQAYTEIDECAQRLARLTGSRGRWFRQSQGQHASAVVRAAATRAGYTTLLSYDLDPRDYLDPGSPAVVRNVLSGVRGGDVVSMHLGHPGTVTALPQILTGLRRRGLRAVTASELFPLASTTQPSPNQNS